MRYFRLTHFFFALRETRRSLTRSTAAAKPCLIPFYCCRFRLLFVRIPPCDKGIHKHRRRIGIVGLGVSQAPKLYLRYQFKGRTILRIGWMMILDNLSVIKFIIKVWTIYFVSSYNHDISLVCYWSCPSPWLSHSCPFLHGQEGSKRH